MLLNGTNYWEHRDPGVAYDLINYEGLPQEVSEGKNFSMLPRYFCDILVKNVATF